MPAVADMSITATKFMSTLQNQQLIDHADQRDLLACNRKWSADVSAAVTAAAIVLVVIGFLTGVLLTFAMMK